MGGDGIHSDDQKVDFHMPLMVAAHFPNWTEVEFFIRGRIHSFDFARQRSPRQGHSMKSSKSRYSFDDIHDIAKGIVRSFASFWSPTCGELKEALASMDPRTTGRIPLSRFYAAHANFVESKSYLRDMGVLDETSVFGVEVIIPNYLQSTANCIVSTAHYRVCCPAECEEIIAEVEMALSSSYVTPFKILAVVENMTIQETLEDDYSPYLGHEMAQLLEKIAADNGGTVPLHGRLFAQWLHYAFPRECPFPSAGKVQMATPSEYGNGSFTSHAERQQHIKKAFADVAWKTLESVPKEELFWMSQWDWSEELRVELLPELAAPTSRGYAGFLSISGILLFFTAALCVKAPEKRLTMLCCISTASQPRNPQMEHFV